MQAHTVPNASVQNTAKRRKGDRRLAWHKNYRNRTKVTQQHAPSRDERLNMDRTLAEWVRDVPTITPADLPAMIERARAFQHVGFQEEVIMVCLVRILACSLPDNAPVCTPRLEQVRTL